jgi:malate permease and related proteins
MFALPVNEKKSGTEMLLRVIEILFPMFFVVFAGYLCARRTGINMGAINRANLEYFAPALVFSALVDIPLGSRQLNLTYASIIAVLFPGLLMLVLCRIKQLDIKTWLPPHMFRNCGNLAIPLFMYTFGDASMGDAVLLMVISTSLQMTVGLFIINGFSQQGFIQLAKAPIIYATVAALMINFSGLIIWQPLKEACNLLGKSSIPLMLFSLGSQLIYLNRADIKIGLTSTATSLLTGAVTFAMINYIIPLPLVEQQMMVLFTMLPPAVMNFLFAERYKLDSKAVAAMVLYGNLLSILTMPVLLWYALSVLK